MGIYLAPVKASDERATPQQFWEQLHKEFHFTRDVCASEVNAKLPEFWTQADDALSQEWDGVCWMNPPYSQTGLWVEKAWRESLRGVTVVALVPAATDTRWWHEYATKASEIRFVRGRLKFNGSKNSAPFPSVVLVFKA